MAYLKTKIGGGGADRRRRREKLKIFPIFHREIELFSKFAKLIKIWQKIWQQENMAKVWQEGQKYGKSHKYGNWATLFHIANSNKKS